MLSVGNAAKEAAIVLERYTGMSRKEAYQGLKSGFSSMSTYFVSNPLALIRELRDINVHVHLVRPGDRGGYTS